MACGGCNKQTVFTPSSQTVVEEKIVTASAPMQQVQQSAPDTSCRQMYDQLVALERKTVSLYNKFRLEVGGKGPAYLQRQRQIRSWIVNLKNGCPDENEYKALANEIGSDYKNLI